MTSDPREQVWQRTMRTREAFASRMAPPPLAWSADGRTFGFRVPVDHPVVAGSFVVLRLPSGEAVLAQALEKRVVDDPGPTADLGPGFFSDAGQEFDSDLTAAVTSVAVQLKMRIANGDGVVLGRITDDGVMPGGVPPFDEAIVEPAEAVWVNQYLAAVDAGRPTIVVGGIAAGTETVPAQLRVQGFGRHTFLCGQSGSGKTFSLGTILERLMVQTTLRIVVLDPNGDFVRITELNSEAAVDATRSVPATDDEYVTFERAHATQRPSVHVHSDLTDLSVSVGFGEMPPHARAAVLRLDPLGDRDEYDASRSAFDDSEHPITHPRDLIGLLDDATDPVGSALRMRVSNLGVQAWRLWSDDGAPTVVQSVQGGSRTTVIDLGSLDSDEERYAASVAVLDALWSTRHERIPTMLVIDEAHNVVPAETSDPVQALAADLVVRIAGEGRKFGLYMLLATQRPDKVHPNALSQCDNLILMRMNSDADLDTIVRTFSFAPEALVRQSRWFRQGEAVAAGPISSGPVRLRFGGRYTAEGGSDIPTTWANGSS